MPFVEKLGNFYGIRNLNERVVGEDADH